MYITESEALASAVSVAATEQEYNGDAPDGKFDYVFAAWSHEAGITAGARYHAAANGKGATFSQRRTTGAPVDIL